MIEYDILRLQEHMELYAHRKCHYAPQNRTSLS